MPSTKMKARALARPDAVRRRANGDATVVHPGEPFLISIDAPGRGQLALARVITGVLAAVFLVTLAYRNVQLARLNSFIPVANTVVALNDFLTAVLLYAQFSVTRARSLLVLAGGFLFKTLILIPHAATFPGVFGPYGLLNGRVQSTAWMFTVKKVALVM